MAKYLLAFQTMAAWNAWYETLGPAVVDGGAPVGPAMTIAPDGSTTEGGGANPVSGYTLITADSLADALAKSKGCPIRRAEGASRSARPSR